MDYKKAIAPTIMGILLTILYGVNTYTLLLGIVMPVLFNMLARGLWIIPIIFLTIMISRGPALALLIITALLLFFLEELFTRESFSLRTMLHYNDLYILFGCIGVSVIAFFYTVMLISASLYTSTGLIAVIAQIYSTREGITVVYIVVLLLALGLLEKVVAPTKKPSLREGVVMKITHRIASYFNNPGLVFTRSMFFLMLITTLYLGPSSLLALIIAYIAYKLFPYKKYSGVLAVTVFIICLMAVGLYSRLYEVDEWLEAIVKNIDASIKYGSG